MELFLTVPHGEFVHGLDREAEAARIRFAEEERKQ